MESFDVNAEQKEHSAEERHQVEILTDSTDNCVMFSNSSQRGSNNIIQKL